MSNVLDNFELYKGKSFSSVCKDIVINQNSKKDQLDVLISDLRNLVKSTNDAVIIIPLIRDFLDIGVKNDEQLVKLINVVQKIVTHSEDGDSGTSVSLTEEERAQLLKEVDEISKQTNTTIEEEQVKSDTGEK